MKLHTLAALLASTIAAAAVAAPSTATSTLPPGVKDMSPDQIDYNLQAIDAAAKEQQELARQKEAARAAAQAAAQEAAAKEKAAAEKRAAAAELKLKEPFPMLQLARNFHAKKLRLSSTA